MNESEQNPFVGPGVGDISQEELREIAKTQGSEQAIRLIDQQLDLYSSVAGEALDAAKQTKELEIGKSDWEESAEDLVVQCKQLLELREELLQEDT